MHGGLLPTVRISALPTAVVACALMLGGCGGHGVGDPGGVILAMLRPVVTAVPPEATAVDTTTHDSVRQRACPGDPRGRSGFTAVSVASSFTTTSPPIRVVDQIGATLARLGWVRHDVVLTRGQGPVPHWTKKIAGNRPADAFAYAVPAGSRMWLLTAEWRPPGFALPGC